MAVKKKKTENQKAFQKERRRLLQAIRRAEKQGYIFPEDIVPETPKRVTKKQLEKIKAIKPKDLYKVGEFVYKDTGEIVPAEQRKQEVKKEAIEKAKQTRQAKKTGKTPATKPSTTIKKPSKTTEQTEVPYYPTISIIDVIRERLVNLERDGKPPVPIDNRKFELISIFDDTVMMYDENIEELEQYLQEHEGEIADLLTVISYDSNSENVNASFVQLGRLLNVTSLSMSQAESLSAMTEYYD